MTYQIVKMIHILSATIMIGTGLGSAFYLFITYKTTNTATVRDVLKNVIFADIIFTTPSVITQLITGLILTEQLNLYDTQWFYLVIIISFFVLILWLGAVVIQYKLKRIIKNSANFTSQFNKLMTIWVILGVPSFLLAIYLYYLMIFKPFI